MEPDVARVLAAIRAEMPPLGRVLHAAMVVEDGALLELTPEQWRRVLAPKVSGAWLLDRLTAGEDLDCFVVFSSAAADVCMADPGRRTELACAYLLRRVAGVLTEPESRIDPDVPLTNPGLDSLVAVELQTLFHVDLGVRVAGTPGRAILKSDDEAYFPP